MSQRHTIRLRGPWWGVVSHGQNDGAEATIGEDDRPFKTTMPLVWPDQISDDFVGTVRLSRKFNCSTGMSEAQEVWLTISSLAVPAEILFNGSPIGSPIGSASPPAKVEFAVCSLLQPFNELVILLKVGGRLPTVLVGDVAIEIAQ